MRKYAIWKASLLRGDVRASQLLKLLPPLPGPMIPQILKPGPPLSPGTLSPHPGWGWGHTSKQGCRGGGWCGVVVAGVVWWGGGWSGDDAGLILVMTMMHDDDDDVLCHRGKDERLKLLQPVCFGCFSRSALVVRLHKLRRSFPASFLSCCSRWFWGQMLSKIDTLKPPECSQAYVCVGGGR